MGSIAFDSVAGVVGLIGVPGFVVILLVAAIGSAFSQKGQSK